MHISSLLTYIPYGKEGGWVMPIIYFFSVLSTAVFLERLWFLRKKNVIPPDLKERIFPLLEREKWDEVATILSPGKTAMERIATSIIRLRSKSKEIIKEIVEDAGKREREKLERGLSIISITVSISPLLGLLGTVSGMIKVFSSISQQAIGNPEKLAAGISEALLTTFAGLTAAIIALLMWNYLTAKVKRFTRELEEFSTELLQKMEEK